MPLKLEDLGFKVGDIVTYDCDDESTGGVIFTIAVNYDSPVPDDQRSRWGQQHFDEKGKRLQPMEVNGYIRLKPIFEFFPTQKGKKPKGKAGTVLIHHTSIKSWRGDMTLRKIDVLAIASKYAELGNLVRDIAIMHGMVQQPSEPAHDSPQE